MRFLELVSAVAFVSTMGLAHAQGDFSNTDIPTAKKISSVFEKQLGLKPDRILISEIPNLYEVHVGAKVFYATEDGKYLIDGPLISTQYKTNITAARVGRLNKVDVSTLPLADAIKSVKGDGSRVIYMFSDPLCTFCKKQDSELAKLDNVTIYTFVVGVLGSESILRAKSILCSKDRLSSWTKTMSGVAIESGNCSSHQLERNQQLFRQLKMSGTPTFIFSNGERFSGYITVADLEAKLSRK